MASSIMKTQKLSQLLEAEDKGLQTYIEAKKQNALAKKLDNLGGKSNKLKIVNRMVPQEKTELAEMLH